MLIIFKVWFPQLHRFYSLPLSFPVTFLHTSWLLCGWITSSLPLFHTGLTVPARLPALVLSWLRHVSVTLLQTTKNGFSKTASPFLIFFCIWALSLSTHFSASHIMHLISFWRSPTSSTNCIAFSWSVKRYAKDSFFSNLSETISLYPWYSYGTFRIPSTSCWYLECSWNLLSHSTSHFCTFQHTHWNYKLQHGESMAVLLSHHKPYAKNHIKTTPTLLYAAMFKAYYSPHSGEVPHIFACVTVRDLSRMHSAKHIPVPLNCSQ